MEHLNVNFTGLGWSAGVLAKVFIAAMVFLHGMLGFGLWNDASRLRERGRSTVVLTPLTWSLSALVLGLPLFPLRQERTVTPPATRAKRSTGVFG
jgi:hypothetical protein